MDVLEKTQYDLGLKDSKMVIIITDFLAKLALHDIELSQLKASEIAGSATYISLNLLKRQVGVKKAEEALERLSEQYGLKAELMRINAKSLLDLSKTFQSQNPKLVNLNKAYQEDLQSLQ
jgi:hypothetical protein